MGNLNAFLSSADFFKIKVSKNSFRNHQCQTVWYQIRPDILSKLFKRLSADDTSRQELNQSGKIMISGRKYLVVQYLQCVMSLNS